MKALQISTTVILLESNLEWKMPFRSRQNLEIQMRRHLEPKSKALMAVRLGLSLYLLAELTVTLVELSHPMLELQSAVALVALMNLMLAA